MRTDPIAASALGIDSEEFAPLLRSLGPLAILGLLEVESETPARASVLEVAVLFLDPGEKDLRLLHSPVRPSARISAAVRRRVGLDASTLADAPPAESIRSTLQGELHGRALVVFDLPAARRFFQGDGTFGDGSPRFLDLRDLLAVTHADAPGLSLEVLAPRVLQEQGELPGEGALPRATLLLRILLALCAGAQEGELRYRAAARALASFHRDCAWRPLLGDAPTAPIAAEHSAYLSIPDSGETPVAFEEEAILDALRDVERGRRYFPGYRVREEQLELTRHFVRTLAGGGFSLIEGGTGVGKSLAYLAAAIPYMLVGPGAEQKQPVLISTRTKLLQDQLVQKDIAAAACFLGYPALRAASIKGRANYLCARLLRTALAEGAQPSVFEQDRMAYAILDAAAVLRPHGEVGAMPRAFSHHYPLFGGLLRQAVSQRSDQCSREECALTGNCPFGDRRKALAGAHLLVVNHDLLLRWPTDYPTFGDVIVDEAHELPGVADEVYAVGVRPEEVLERFDDVFGTPRGEAGLLTSAMQARVGREAKEWRASLHQELRAFGESLSDLANDYGELEVPAEPGPEFDAAGEVVEVLALRFAALAQEIAHLRDEEEETGERSAAFKRFEEEFLVGASALRRIFGSEEELVSAFTGIAPPFDRWRLAMRPVSPAELFQNGFLAQLDSFAGVSATLFIEGDSFAALGELEIESWAAERLERISVPSPFPYAEQMRVLAMRSRGQLVEEMTTVLGLMARRLGGRTLGLFTSLRRMEEVAECLRRELAAEGIEVLVPRSAGDDPAALVGRFRQAERAVLLGSRTFWQGLDLPGEDLQCVVIEKLPFEVPTQLRKRREGRLREAGVNSFRRYTLGKMLLSLKQMIGRLIRSEDDRGVVVIVESRHDRGYFSALNEAMPPDVRVALAQSAELSGFVDAVGIPLQHLHEGELDG